MSSNIEKEPGPQGDSPNSNTPVELEKKKREYKDFEHDTEKATRTFISFLLFPYSSPIFTSCF